MHRLELKLPPPVVAAILAVIAWRLARSAPALALGLPQLLRDAVATPLVAAGLALDAIALRSFFGVKTTINPLDPTRTSKLVETGVYRFTRNPMYLGLLLMLSAWTLWLDHALAAATLPAFVAYITRFQIMPEERILAAQFGDDYARYATRVPRWL